MFSELTEPYLEVPSHSNSRLPGTHNATRTISGDLGLRLREFISRLVLLTFICWSWLH